MACHMSAHTYHDLDIKAGILYKPLHYLTYLALSHTRHLFPNTLLRTNVEPYLLNITDNQDHWPGAPRSVAVLLCGHQLTVLRLDTCFTQDWLCGTTLRRRLNNSGPPPDFQVGIDSHG